MDTLETHTLHPLNVSTILYVVILFRSAASLLVVFLKQTHFSYIFVRVFFLHHSRPTCCLCLDDQTDVENGEKKKSVKWFIWRSSNWLTECRQIENISVYIETNYVIDPVCSNILLCDSIVQKVSIIFSLILCRLIASKKKE